MKTLIVCVSVHHENTDKIAKAMARVLRAKIVRPQEITPEEILGYDLVGFGSGIYYFKHHKSLLEFVEGFPRCEGKAFVFSTRGIGPVLFYHRALKKKLLEKGFTILGEFSCKGLVTFGFLGLIGGLNRGRPNDTDLVNAENFARQLMERSGKEALV